jgi:hypothetical protein
MPSCPPITPEVPIPRPTRALNVHVCMGAVVGPTQVSFSYFFFPFFSRFEEIKT